MGVATETGMGATGIEGTETGAGTGRGTGAGTGGGVTGAGGGGGAMGACMGIDSVELPAAGRTAGGVAGRDGGAAGACRFAKGNPRPFNRS